VAFEHTLRVRFHQADPAGVLFYGRLFELVEETYEAFCRAAGLDIDALMRQEGLTTPVVRASADFTRPMRVGEQVTVRLTVARLGNASFTLDYDFLCANGEPRAKARVVHVFVDATCWRKHVIPDDVRERLARDAYGPAASAAATSDRSSLPDEVRGSGADHQTASRGT